MFCPEMFLPDFNRIQRILRSPEGKGVKLGPRGCVSNRINEHARMADDQTTFGVISLYKFSTLRGEQCPPLLANATSKQLGPFPLRVIRNATACIMGSTREENRRRPILGKTGGTAPCPCEVQYIMHGVAPTIEPF